MKKFFLLFFLLGVFDAAFSQTRIDFKIAKSRDRRDMAAKFRQYQLLSIDLKKTTMSLQLGGGIVELRLPDQHPIKAELAAVELLSADYFENIGRSGKVAQKKDSKLRTYQGALTNGEGYMALTIDDDFFSAVISSNGRMRYIEQGRYLNGDPNPETLISYDAADVISGSELGECGVEFTENKARELMPLRQERAMANSCEAIRLAIAADSSMRAKFGSAQAVTDHIVAVMNSVSVLYRHEFADNIEFIIATIYQSDAAVSEPLLPNTSSTAAGTVLSAFADWGRGGNFKTAYDLAQLWTNRDFDGSTVGLAYVGTICGGSGYHILQDFSGNISSLSVMTAHEIGHNLGASHDAGGAPYIMAPSVNSSSNWSDVSRGAVDAKLGSVTCLASCAGDIIPAFNVAPFATCPGGTIQFKDKTVNGTGRNWTFEGGSPSVSSDPRPAITYPATGVFDVTLKSNDAPALSAKNYMVVNNPELNKVSCALPAGTPGDAGIKYLSINSIQASSGTATQDGSRYVDRSCQYVTELKPNTAYDFTVSIGNYDGGTTPTIYETVKIYIDYNGDGVFNESNEKVSDANGAMWAGYLSYSATNRSWLRFTTPADMAKNKILRLRVLTDTSTPADACYNPGRGQVEDYGVVFSDVSTALPVDLVSFSGKAMGRYNLLKWEVTNESDMAEYALERGEQPREFTSKGSVASSNVGRERFNYELEDDQIDPAVPGYYYRLRMEETDGKSKYSKIIYVPNGDPESELSLRNCETLIKQSSIHYEISSNKDRSVTITVNDLTGNRIKTWDKPLTKGLNLFEDDLSGLNAGLYLFAIESTDKPVIVRKVLKAGK